MVWGFGDCGLHAVEIKTLGRLGKVRVGCCGQMYIAEDLVVVCPSGVTEVDCWGAWVESGYEKSSDMYSACSGYCLHGCHAILSDGR